MASPPQVKEGIGEKTQFKELKMELKSHPQAVFDSDTNVFKIELKCKEDVRSIFNLHHFKADGAEDEELKMGCLIMMASDKIVYRVAVPYTGWYKLNIFATPTSNKTNSLPCVFTYLFNVKRVTVDALPYPKQFADWKKTYYLHSPKYLRPGQLSNVLFKVTVPDAKRVAVKAGDEWTHLTKKGADKWEGTVRLDHYAGKTPPVLANLNASLGSDETQFATLLQYEL